MLFAFVVVVSSHSLFSCFLAAEPDVTSQGCQNRKIPELIFFPVIKGGPIDMPGVVWTASQGVQVSKSSIKLVKIMKIEGDIFVIWHPWLKCFKFRSKNY